MYWAGVDIGGTKIAASIAADDAVILGTVRRATPPGADFSPVFEAAAAMVGELLAARGATLKELSGGQHRAGRAHRLAGGARAAAV